MYNEIIANLEKQLSKEDFENILSKTIHLGIFREPYLTYMLDGRKTIESRFSKNKVAPYQQISKDDIVLVKKSSGNIIAYFTMKEVLFFDLTRIKINEIKEKYDAFLFVDDDFWASKQNSRFATLIVFDKIYLLDPFPIKKRGMQTWIKVEHITIGSML